MRKINKIQDKLRHTGSAILCSLSILANLFLTVFTEVFCTFTWKIKWRLGNEFDYPLLTNPHPAHPSCLANRNKQQYIDTQEVLGWVDNPFVNNPFVPASTVHPNAGLLSLSTQSLGPAVASYGPELPPAISALVPQGQASAFETLYPFFKTVS